MMDSILSVSTKFTCGDNKKGKEMENSVKYLLRWICVKIYRLNVFIVVIWGWYFKVFKKFLLWNFHFYLTHWLLRTFFVHSSILGTEWDEEIENWQFSSTWGKQQKSREGRALNKAWSGAQWKLPIPSHPFPSTAIPAGCCPPYSYSWPHMTTVICSWLSSLTCSLYCS